ncbi:MurR/RpiR family transcriptional regulator [Ornithinibacillus xuwenensis]|uniref:HTH rpiR-type domain-containing protein n=1 Tax=Ornithinibacillus xuwenensis TaxID=3144668 RepID=A0ABU9XKF3_9BACI
MKANRISLLHSLFSVINENDENDTNYVLAHYFLNHYHELSHLNIYEVSEACFVSRSSVRRFCKSIGYENFLDLKHEFSSYDDRYESYMRYAKRDNYRETLTKEINEMIIELDKRMDTREVYEIAKRIRDSRQTVFLTSGTTAGFVRDFQESMVFNKKVISLVSELYSDNPCYYNQYG